MASWENLGTEENGDVTLDATNEGEVVFDLETDFVEENFPVFLALNNLGLGFKLTVCFPL